MSVDLEGYRDEALALLSNSGVSVGDLISIEATDKKLKGFLMPRYGYSDDKHIVIKLENGYNVGVGVSKITKIVKLAVGPKPTYANPPPPAVDKDLPPVSIISTGGTIASRVDYRTGGVHPALSAGDLYSAVPELSRYARVDAEVLSSIYSENMTPLIWTKIAERVAEKIKQGYVGVIVTHGTDTMGYTAAALSFALQGVPVPVILVGSQRSSDRPSSDSATNLIAAVTVAARAGFSGVYVLMHSGMSDDDLSIHLGTKVRKNHTSSRDAFESVNVPPAAYLRKGENVENVDGLPRRSSTSLSLKPHFEERVALVKFYPNLDPAILEYLVERGYKGILLEGTGLGHVSSKCYEPIRRAGNSGVIVAMTSQCLWGRVRMTVYDTGRDLLSLGVLPLGDMLPETAYVKMMWVLANTKSLEDAKETMTKNLVGEMASRSLLDRRPA